MEPSPASPDDTGQASPDAAGGPAPGPTADDRLPGLFDAIRSVVGDLDLTAVLRGIVSAACRLVDARYAALGVIDPSGQSLAQFVTAGLDAHDAEAIGDLPHGRGLLGALIDDPQPIRLDRLGDDPRAVGFPARHPPMSSFLGVPVRVRGEVFGNLYLAEASAGRFTADDERLVSALADIAGVAVENARLFSHAAQRQRWLEASTVITRQLLAESGEDPLSLIARIALDIAAADLVTVVLPSSDPATLVVEVSAGGPGALDLQGHTYPREGSLVGAVLDTGRPVLLVDARSTPWPWHQLESGEIGPVMVLPLAGVTAPRGALAIGRLPRSTPFNDDDLTMAGGFANQAALALELADARASHERMGLLEDRDRIARDLHDHVIQRLFAAGLRLEGLASAMIAQGTRERLASVVDDLDTTIGQIRTAVFELRVPFDDGRSARRQVLDVVAEVTPLLPSAPAVRFEGPVDAVLSDGALTDILATVREALTNAGRHARATAVSLVLRADADRAELVVEDDGVGLRGVTRRSGLANLAARADRRHGTLEVAAAGGPPDREGTRLTWTIGLR